MQACGTMDHGDEFTFAVVPPSVAVDGGGVFLKGALLYPVFGRPRSPPRPPEPETATVRVPLAQLRLLVDGDEPSSPAQPPDDDLDSVPAEMYCPWSPGWSPARCRKSRSTGSSVLRWRPRLVGRSQSDGKKFVLLNTSATSGPRSKGRDGEDGCGVGGHAWSYYATKGSGGSNGARRTSFLPYKQDLVGLFANAAALRRSYHPF